jgi:hypothetical protein
MPVGGRTPPCCLAASLQRTSAFSNVKGAFSIRDNIGLGEGLRCSGEKFDWTFFIQEFVGVHSTFSGLFFRQRLAVFEASNVGTK